MTRTLASLSLASSLAALVGCNAYNPKLGFEPFQCGDTEPRCPDGYTCTTYDDGQAICQLTGAEAPDGGTDAEVGFRCYDDRVIEPNDVKEQALDTQIPDQQVSFSLVPGSICPSNDEDFFKLDVTAPDSRVTVDLTYRPSLGILLVDLLKQDGTTAMASAAPVDGAPNTLRLEVQTAPVGKYYVRVKSEEGVVNNYDALNIVVAAP